MTWNCLFSEKVVREPTEEVKSRSVRCSISDREAFARRIPQNRTDYHRFREKAGLVRAGAKEVRSLQSGLTSRNREKWPEFASFATN